MVVTDAEDMIPESRGLRLHKMAAMVQRRKSTLSLTLLSRRNLRSFSAGESSGGGDAALGLVVPSMEFAGMVEYQRYFSTPSFRDREGCRRISNALFRGKLEAFQHLPDRKLQLASKNVGWQQ